MKNIALTAAIILTVSSGFSLHAQTKVIIHPPQAELKLPGLLRPLHLTLAKYTIERHPGWQAKETYDSATHIVTLEFCDPNDTSTILMRCTSQSYDRRSFDSIQWNKTKEHIRTGYGDRGVGVMPLFDSSLCEKPVNGIIGRYEVLARHPDRIEYCAAIMTTSEGILLTANFPSEDFSDRLTYFRTIARDIRSK
ncbi:MAG TPA: hypothetical protein VEW28_11125 [Candidatus Kapabacteria bacterium]|nr:hypothetical protein [Candidatus Kapabacteria bacterium]